MLKSGCEDEPFVMSDLPEFCSCEKNVVSIIGRLLNPDCQSMSSLILNMPRKWQLVGRVRGVALSQEKFQFIFKHKHDMEAILERGVHTYNEWAIAIDRWVENPPADYLQFISVWFQIRNIPVNHYTVQAITALGEIIGEVKEVILDPTNPQNQDFVRVRVIFDVSKPLRRAKMVHFKGVPINILFDFERVQKRCFTCQRLSHEQGKCPILMLKKEEELLAGKQRKSGVQQVPEKVIKESDILFGVLEEHQVGLNPATGRPRIAPEVIVGMRQYLMVAEGAERVARVERIKKSLEDLKNDPIGDKTCLRLEQPPVVSGDISKGKGIVFQYKNLNLEPKEGVVGPKNMNAGISKSLEEKEMSWVPESAIGFGEGSCSSFRSEPSLEGSTVFKTGLSEASFSGTLLKNGKPRKKPFKSRSRKTVKQVIGGTVQEEIPEVDKAKELMAERAEIVVYKRKATDEAKVPSKVAKCNTKEMVPKEGLSKQ